MNTIDILILICFIPAMVQGVTKGFIAQLTSLVSVILGAWLSFKFSNLVCEWLKPYLDIPQQILQVIAFILIMTAVIIGLYFIGKMLISVIRLAMLGWLDRCLGVLFAFLKTAVVVGIVIILFNTVNTNFHIVKESLLDQSVLYPIFKDAAYTVFPYFKEYLFKN